MSETIVNPDAEHRSYHRGFAPGGITCYSFGFLLGLSNQKGEEDMTCKRPLGLFACVVAAAFLVVPGFAQTERGKAEMKAGSGSITVDYGRPSLQGRDPLALQKEGSSWRMGKDAATTLSTPVDLTFGATKIAKGSYTLQLFRASADAYEIVFTPKEGEAIKVAVKKMAGPNSVEVFTIELVSAPKGGSFVMTWGTARLTADFQTGS
jgi:hypothetical protein